MVRGVVRSSDRHCEVDDTKGTSIPDCALFDHSQAKLGVMMARAQHARHSEATTMAQRHLSCSGQALGGCHPCGWNVASHRPRKRRARLALASGEPGTVASRGVPGQSLWRRQAVGCGKQCFRRSTSFWASEPELSSAFTGRQCGRATACCSAACLDRQPWSCSRADVEGAC